jgi:hypothetical protein
LGRELISAVIASGNLNKIILGIVSYGDPEITLLSISLC